MRLNGKSWPHGYFDVSSDGKVESDDLQQHIQWLIGELLPRKEKIIFIQEKYKPDSVISCFGGFESGHFGLELTHEMLSALSDLNLSVELDIYTENK